MFDQEVSTTKSAVDALAQAANDAVTSRDAQITLDQSTIVADAVQIADLKAQLANIPPPSPALTVYDHLESKTWTQTSTAASNVGGSGLGVASQKQPSVECAELSIIPQLASVLGKSNYFDCYYHQDFAVDDGKKHFRLEASYLFPTLADATAPQCLEMEARQVTGGKMVIIALQLEFSGNHLRYWDATNKWTSSGVAMPRFLPNQWYTVVLEGHRDSVNVYHDQITINGVVTTLNKSYPLPSTTWRSLTRCAIQLDGNGKGDPYRVKIDNVKYTLSA